MISALLPPRKSEKPTEGRVHAYETFLVFFMCDDSTSSVLNAEVTHAGLHAF